jgi:hypothetical protein
LQVERDKVEDCDLLLKRGTHKAKSGIKQASRRGTKKQESQ